MSNITEKDIKLFYEMLERDKNSAHFLWDCAAGTVVSAGSGIFADVSGDPLEYLRESGLIDPQSLPSFNIFSSCIEEGTISGSDRMSLAADIRMKLSADGEFRLCGFYAHFLKDDGGRIIAVHGTIRPYTSRELFDRRVLSGFSSDRDPRIFSDEAAEMIKRHPNEEIAFIQFDVERFKLINEKYGVEAGDELLEFLYGTLGLICSEEQPFARLNADVFMVVTTFSSDSDLLDFIHRIESMLTGFQNMEYRLIFGVAIVEDRSLHIRRHGDNAALARQSIKGNALNNIGFFNGRMKSELHKKQSIEDDMMNALLDGQFVMYLQPKFSISTKRIIGAEALARWIHPEKGMISPADFVPEKLEVERPRRERSDRPHRERGDRPRRERRPREERPITPSVPKERELIPVSEECMKKAEELATSFISGLMEKMGVEGQVTVLPQVECDQLRLELSGPDMGPIIGRRGDTLDAIQYLGSLVLNNALDEHVRLSVDTENYREKRAESLERLARKMAMKVVKAHRSMTLEPMNPYERRIIHAALQDFNGVTTYSTGTEPSRRVVIAPDSGRQRH